MTPVVLLIPEINTTLTESVFPLVEGHAGFFPGGVRLSPALIALLTFRAVLASDACLPAFFLYYSRRNDDKHCNDVPADLCNRAS